MAKVIGIISLKGGVGKTSTVVSLGAAIATLNRKVLLIDANYSAPNLGLHLDMVQTEKTINKVLDGKMSGEEAISNCGIFDLIPADLDNPQVKDPLKLKQKIKSLRNQYDVILIDSSPALNDETLSAMTASDELLVVTTPDMPTLSTTLRAVKLAKRRKTPIIGLILNKVYKKSFEISLSDVEEAVGVPVMAIIPYDISVIEALSNTVPSTLQNKRSKGTEEYMCLAAALVGEEYRPPFRFRHLLSGRGPKRQEINRTLYDKTKRIKRQPKDLEDD